MTDATHDTRQTTAFANGVPLPEPPPDGPPPAGRRPSSDGRRTVPDLPPFAEPDGDRDAPDRRPAGTTPAAGVRPVSLTREGQVLRVAFGPKHIRELVPRVKQLPFAAFDPTSKTWTVGLYRESVEGLRRWFLEGLCDVAPDRLVDDLDDLPEAPPAVLRSGSRARPYMAATAYRDDAMFARLRSVPSGRWEKRAAAWSYGPSAAPALAELVDRGALADPDGLLQPAEATIMFDVRKGAFKVRAGALSDEAQGVFDAAFPQRDVVAAWRDKGIGTAFADDFSAEVYAGELQRAGGGLQPEGLAVSLFPYQRQDVAVALARSGLGVFLAPGLGKTMEAVAVGFERLRRGDVSRVLCIVPGGVVTHWQKEIVRATGNDRVVMVRGTPARRKELYAQAADADWVVVSWGLILPRYDSADIAALAEGALVVFDEAHRAKTPKIPTTESARKIARKASYRLALTGTPAENEPGEWYSVLGQLAVPDAFGSPYDFLTRYQYPGKFGGFEGARNINELRKVSAPHLVRHTKSEVAEDLPPLQVATQRVDADSRYAALLRRVHREARDEIADERRQRSAGGVDDELLESGAEMTAVGMLRLLCCSPRLIAESEAPSAQALVDAKLVPDEDGPKLDWLRTTARELRRVSQRRQADGVAPTPDTVSGERMVVFCSSRRMVQLTASRLQDDGLSVVVYHGESSVREREDAVERFTDPESDVQLFVATDAAAEGLNLGRCCQQLVNLDLAWTPGRMIQRANRIHRIDGTASWYQVTNLVLAATVEEGILRRLETKADLSDALFGETDARAATTGRRVRTSATALLDEALAEWDG